MGSQRQNPGYMYQGTESPGGTPIPEYFDVSDAPASYPQAHGSAYGSSSSYQPSRQSMHRHPQGPPPSSAGRQREHPDPRGSARSYRSSASSSQPRPGSHYGPPEPRSPYPPSTHYGPPMPRSPYPPSRPSPHYQPSNHHSLTPGSHHRPAPPPPHRRPSTSGPHSQPQGSRVPWAHGTGTFSDPYYMPRDQQTGGSGAHNDPYRIVPRGGPAYYSDSDSDSCPSLISSSSSDSEGYPAHGHAAPRGARSRIVSYRDFPGRRSSGR
ncbi:hypothetical protein F4781DRAFT_431518 [Annulohypoxylon bovei var. microspora]|nr:hypothetical protein F4781DRAFT_431518 [Annulohypoxylon bovei var. microspora]